MNCHLGKLPRWRAFLVAQMVKNLPAMQKTRVQSLGWEDSLEKGVVIHSSILAWRIPWFNEALAHTVKNLPASAGELGLISELGRSPGKGNGNPLQYSCLENPTDRGSPWAIVHGVTKSRTRLSN